LHGGASQIDTFDPKPGSGNGGEFRAIESAVSGLRLSQHLPQLAKRMNHLALIRSLTAKEGNHERARTLLHTGYAPQGGVEHPGLGAHHVRSLASKRSVAPSDLPRQVSLNIPGQSAGYLGARWSAFTVPDAASEVRNLAPPTDLPRDRTARRVELWRALDEGFAKDHPAPQVQGARAIGEQAVAMSAAPEIAAFDLAQESAQTRARYGLDRELAAGKDGAAFVSGCLMARRLLESGVDFVEVGLRGWDTHEDNFNRVRKLSEALDRGASALIDDLIANGLWSETLLVCVGDFG
ncbi:MAG: DUF1501 domain-containing protein, partial [Myxococcales bacterium]|nr:DUF1501 domain-containing protein [Myxococcales bacterium]